MKDVFGISIEVYIILFILGIPTYFLLSWLLKRIIKVEKTRKIVTWTATIIVTPLVFIAIAIIILTSLYYYPTYNFDKQKWKSNIEKRYELSEDIIASKLLIGKTKIEVEEILGKENNSITSDYWTYYLGFRPGLMSIDPDVLDIYFKDGKVVKVGQHET